MKMVGIAHSIPDVLTFVTPIFADESGAHVVQVVRDGRVVTFERVHIREGFDAIAHAVAGGTNRDVGDPPLYGFQVSNGLYALGSFSALRKNLMTIIQTEVATTWSRSTKAAVQRFIDSGSAPTEQIPGDFITYVKHEAISLSAVGVDDSKEARTDTQRVIEVAGARMLSAFSGTTRTGLRIVTSLACALLLVYVADVDSVLATLGRCEPQWALVSTAALLIDRILTCYKWGLLIEIRGYSISLLQRLMIYCSAMIWGLALPGTVGADGIRVMLVRRLGVRVDDALASILVERGIGSLVALLTAVAGLLTLRTMLPHNAIYDYFLILGIAGLLAGICLLLFSFSNNALTAVLQLLPRRFSDGQAARLLVRLHQAYASLGNDRRRIAAFSVLTLVEHILAIVCYALIAVTLRVEFDVIFMFAAIPLAALVSRLPVLIDGLGIYEVIFVAIMALGGVQPADALAVSLVARALQISVWLPWWLMFAARIGIRPPNEVTALATPAGARGVSS